MSAGVVASLAAVVDVTDSAAIVGASFVSVVDDDGEAVAGMESNVWTLCFHTPVHECPSAQVNVPTP